MARARPRSSSSRPSSPRRIQACGSTRSIPGTGAPTRPLELPARAAAALDFVLPPELEAGEPPEARGLARDEVRLMVSYLDSDRVEHARFRDLPSFLRAGDVLAINTSGTMNAAL